MATTRFTAHSARYVRVTMLHRATQWGMSIWSASVFGPADTTPATPAPIPATPTPAPAPAPTTTFVSPDPAPAPAPAAEPAPAGSALRRIDPTTRVRLAGTVAGTRTRIEVLSVTAPDEARVRVRCEGNGCPARVRTRRGSATFRVLRRAVRAGTVLEVFITQPRTYGKYTRFRFRRDAAPRRTDGCVVPGTRVPVACPA